MRILFSPVGGSDPIKRMLDGPMLHCCRVYKPDIVCLYFTQSMLEYENRDQRYTWALEKLGEKLNHKFEIIKIEREDLVDVHKFYIFYNDFGKIFEEIARRRILCEHIIGYSGNEKCYCRFGGIIRKTY